MIGTTDSGISYQQVRDIYSICMNKYVYTHIALEFIIVVHYNGHFDHLMSYHYFENSLILIISQLNTEISRGQNR
jgi:hypothetical protein